jgi:Fic family protein
MKELVSQIPVKKETLHPIDFASWLHLEFVSIHPFIDGNGRAARLLMNLVLMQEGYPIVVIPPVLRKEYLDAIRLAQIKKTPEIFYDFTAEVVIESLRDYKRLVRLK